LMTHFVTFPLLAMLLGGMRSRVVMLGVASRSRTAAIPGAMLF